MSTETELFLETHRLNKEVFELLTAPGADVNFDASGHDIGDCSHPRELLRHRHLDIADIQVLRALRDAQKTRTPQKKFLAIETIDSINCGWCGERPKWESNGVMFRATNACEYPNGFDLTVDLNVPSGVIVVGNDFRSTFDTDVELDNDHHSSVRYSQGFERDKCACLYVGNSCPIIREAGRDRFAVVSTDWKNGKGRPKLGKSRGQIVTNLWWYMAVDLDEAKRRKLPGIEDAIKLKVRPGMYHFSHEMHKKGFDSDAANLLYTTIESF